MTPFQKSMWATASTSNHGAGMCGPPRLQATMEQASPDHTGFYILDVNSGKIFLVDIVTTVSIFPPLKDDRGLPSDNRGALVAANSSPITCYGTRTMKISIMGRDYNWPFLITDVKVSLAHHGLLTHPTAEATRGQACIPRDGAHGNLQEDIQPVVKKLNGSWRTCGNYRRLNLAMMLDHYPLPNTQDLTWALHGAIIFSKMDLLKSYLQVPVHPDDIPKTAIITPFVPYVFSYSTFDTRGPPGAREDSSEVTAEEWPCGRFDKCTDGAEKVKFQGHELSKGGMRPVTSKMKAVNKFPAPTFVKSLKEFIGMANYYWRFLPNQQGWPSHQVRSWQFPTTQATFRTQPCRRDGALATLGQRQIPPHNH
ncbi:uncharacterized protein [Palaemon carinicauda]|uniref:uncharacterized protein n=1 Tax=Palaemon carinicauda TaxID=392227 RepID=UPI0035B6AB0F